MLERVWRKKNPPTLLVGMYICAATIKTVWRFFKKLKIELPYDPAIPLLGIYPDKTVIRKDTCTPVFTAALFTIAKTGKKTKCPSTDEWIKKTWYRTSLVVQWLRIRLPRLSGSMKRLVFHSVNVRVSQKKKKESACQCRGHGFKPWSGKIPHAAEQLSPCATTLSLRSRVPRATTAEPACHNY